MKNLFNMINEETNKMMKNDKKYIIMPNYNENNFYKINCKNNNYYIYKHIFRGSMNVSKELNELKENILILLNNNVNLPFIIMNKFEVNIDDKYIMIYPASNNNSLAVKENYNNKSDIRCRISFNDINVLAYRLYVLNPLRNDINFKVESNKCLNKMNGYIDNYSLSVLFMENGKISNIERINLNYFLFMSKYNTKVNNNYSLMIPEKYCKINSSSINNYYFRNDYYNFLIDNKRYINMVLKDNKAVYSRYVFKSESMIPTLDLCNNNFKNDDLINSFTTMIFNEEGTTIKLILPLGNFKFIKYYEFYHVKYDEIYNTVYNKMSFIKNLNLEDDILNIIKSLIDLVSNSDLDKMNNKELVGFYLNVFKILNENNMNNINNTFSIKILNKRLSYILKNYDITNDRPIFSKNTKNTILFNKVKNLNSCYENNDIIEDDYDLFNDSNKIIDNKAEKLIINNLPDNEIIMNNDKLELGNINKIEEEIKTTNNNNKLNDKINYLKNKFKNILILNANCKYKFSLDNKISDEIIKIEFYLNESTIIYDNDKFYFKGKLVPLNVLTIIDNNENCYLTLDKNDNIIIAIKEDDNQE